MMGTVNTTITIKNYSDIKAVEFGLKNEEDIRQTTVEAVVDTGAPTLCITEELRDQLGLGIMGRQPYTIANGQVTMVKRAQGVEIHWQDRSMICSPLVVPGGKEILMGAVALEEMDLIVDPKREVLVGAVGDEIVHRILGGIKPL